MLGNRSRDTQPEVRVRSALHRAGLRFRKHYAPLRGKRTRVDVAFTRWRVAVQIDGCFWHSCPVHGTQPAAHTDYWAGKLTRNVARDRDSDRALAEAGWTVLRFWEHESPEDVAAVVARVLQEKKP